MLISWSVSPLATELQFRKSLMIFHKLVRELSFFQDLFIFEDKTPVHMHTLVVSNQCDL